jgi:hypothetical protein
MKSRNAIGLALGSLGVICLALLSACGDDDDDNGVEDSNNEAESEDGNGEEAQEPEAVETAFDPEYRPVENYSVDINPEDFTTTIDNPLLPFTPGSRWVYESETEDGLERIEVEVTDETREVMGVTTIVVHDEVFLDGELIEDTFDWYAQDSEGNVWYFGEETAELEDGEVVSTEGSWEAGVDGALPGIVMPADPQPGDEYFQEFYEGEAEDYARIVSVGESVEVPFGSFDDCVVTEDLNPFEPDVIEHKSYCPGIGMTLEEKVAGSDERVELIEFTEA